MTTSDSDPGSDQEEVPIEAAGGSEADVDGGRSMLSRDYWDERIEGGWDSLESKRSKSRLIDTGIRAFERNKRIPVSLLASALAARIVVYVIPFMVLAVVATGLYSSAYNTDPVDTAREAGMPGLLAEAVEDSTEASRGFRTLTLISMTLVTIWTADSLAKLVRRIHALVWVTPMQRPRDRWMLPITVIGLSVSSLASARVGLSAQEWSAFVRAGELVFEIALLSGIWLLVSRYLPHDPAVPGWRHLVPGALLVGLGITAMKAVMAFYMVPRAVALAERYDEVATAIVMLTWGYWIAFIIVFAAVLNASLFRSHQERSMTV